MASEVSEIVVETVVTPSAGDIDQYRHDFSVLPDDVAEALRGLAAKIDEARRSPPAGVARVVKSGEVARETVAEFAHDWLTELVRIIEALCPWNNDSGVRIVGALDRRWDRMIADGYYDVGPKAVAGWITRHQPSATADADDIEDATDAVVACVEVVPPPEVSILGRLAQTGAQKIVFDADWQLGEEHRSVVLKKFITEDQQLVLRESRTHPLVIQHPNIIRSYRVRNVANEEFLVERKITVLNNAWRARGYHEAALLLADIARALAFLDGQGYVHGDVKPDNVGREYGNFILLDFGVCRPWVKFLGLESGTGSMRTRAPEVLHNDSRNSAAADVWSLGATVFRALPEIGRFPLYETPDEGPPRVKAGSPEAEEAREEYRKLLCERTENDWQDLVVAPLSALKLQNLRLGELLEGMLELNPQKRITADEALDEALRHLGGLIGEVEGPHFPPLQETRQFTRYLATDKSELRQIPRAKYTLWRERVGDLEQGLEAEEAEKRLSAELLKYCEALSADLTDEAARAAVITLQLDLQSREGEQPLYKDLLAEVRNRIDIAEDPETKRTAGLQDGREDTLVDSLVFARRFPEVASYKSFLPVADALLVVLRDD